MTRNSGKQIKQHRNGQGKRAVTGALLSLFGRAAQEWLFQGALLAVIASLCAPLTAQERDGDGRRSFTVKDSIEISYFLDPSRRTDGHRPEGQPFIYSPDGKYALMVTQRGVLSTNCLEATIWLLDVQSVRKYLHKSEAKPQPRKLVTMAAVSNTPVVSDVRWIEKSLRISFLGKDKSSYQRLFVMDTETGVMKAVTRENLYVTAYDMRGSSIAYTVLDTERPRSASGSDLTEVQQNDIYALLYRRIPAVEDLGDITLGTYSHVLYVQKDGKDVAMNFAIGEVPLRLFSPNAFSPALFLSPDGRFLVTLAPVAEIPDGWQQYQPISKEDPHLKPGPVQETSLAGTSFRPEQYVIVSLDTGLVAPLIDAPAGPSLGYDIATDVFWLDDNRHVILANTYLPLSKGVNETTRIQRIDHPAVALVDVLTRECEANIELMDSYETQTYHIDGITWDRRKQELTVSRYGGSKRDMSLFYSTELDKSASVPAPEIYALRSREWVKVQGPGELQHLRSEPDMKMSVREDLNRPPVLAVASSEGKSDLVLWDPNPQMKGVRLGRASVYQWRDDKGREWSGILALPPGDDPKRRYPMVIQTHGYGDEDDQFFADGAQTTSSGGRALVAKGIVVLQMNEFFKSLATPEEGPDQESGFESAINQLVADGIVDRSRIGVIGFSRTCFHVLYTLTHRPNLFRVASITDGVTFGYVEYTLSMNGEEAERINGGAPFGDNLTKWRQSAPNFNLDRIQAPLLISAYLPGQVLSEWETYSGLRRLHKPVEMLWWWKENTPHYLVQPHQRFISQQLAVDWFDFWLNNEEDSNPAKREQYNRWRTLRKVEDDEGLSHAMPEASPGHDE